MRKNAALAALVALVGVLGCDASPGSIDGATPLQTLERCEVTEAPDAPLPFAISTLLATVEPAHPRMAAERLLDPSTAEGEAAYGAMGFGRVVQGPPRPRVTRGELALPGPAQSRRSLAYFVLLSDFQLSDDESPARWALTDSPEDLTSSALRPQEAYLPRAISALNRTLTQIEAATRPFDAGIITGDCADTGQLNELRWVIALMDGQPIETDSGADDDPVPGPDNDPKDPFTPVAFPAPWLYVPGNHDLEVIGVLAPDDEQRARAIGTEPPLGTRDYRLHWAEVTTGSVPADEERRLVTRDDVVAELLGSPSTPGPPGHGYRTDTDTTLGANYVYDVVPGLLRLITIDTNDPEGGSEGMIRQPQVDGFLMPALVQAERDGVLVVLASHHSTTSIDRARAEFGRDREDALSPEAIERLVADQRHVIAWLVGHSHQNRVRLVNPDGRRGYWEVMTPALADWPSQGRIVELVDDGNGNLSLYVTVFDWVAETCLERRFRRLMVMDYVSGWGAPVFETDGDVNVRMIVPTPGIAEAAVAAASGSAEIESETRLAR